MKLIATLVLALSISVSTGHADSKSWSAVKGLLPDSTSSVVGANVSTLRGTSIYAQVVPMLLAKQPDAKKAVEMTKSSCAIDLRDSILDATFALGADERGVIVLALDKSIDQKKVIDCMQKIIDADAKSAAATADLKAEAAKGNSGGLKSAGKKPPPVAKAPAPVVKAPPAPPKLVTKTTGKITEYGLDNSSDRVYVAWLAPDVVAIATDPDDKALLERMLAGKGMKGQMSTLIGKTSSKSAVWLATTKPAPVPTGGTMKAAFGTVQATKGNVALDLNIIMASAKEAKTFVDQATELIASSKGGLPPQFARLVDAVKLSAANDATNIKLSAPEKDISSLLALAMMNL